MFEKPTCKLGSNIVHFVVFCSFLLFFFILVVQILKKLRDMIWIEVKSTLIAPFLTNSTIGMVSFVKLLKVVF